MVDAWSTIVTREPEWDDYGRARAMALGESERLRCPTCQNYDALVPLKSDLRYVRWAEHGNRRVEVAQYRCIYCGASELVRRDWEARHEKDKPVEGRAAPGDGRMFVARPITKET